MTDKEKLLKLFDIYEQQMDSIESILTYFLGVYEKDINIRRIYDLVKILNYCLEQKVDKLESARFVANERATCLKKYLSGTMWPNEEIAKQYLEPQIENAQAIIDACNFE